MSIIIVFQKLLLMPQRTLALNGEILEFSGPGPPGIPSRHLFYTTAELKCIPEVIIIIIE
jgi:hypothetical protein